MPTGSPPPNLRHRRPSVPSPSGSSGPSALHSAESAITSATTKLTTALHISWDDLPPWRRDNPSILTSYRPTSNSYTLSFLSLFHLHNESVNIWTHLLGSVLFTLLSLYLYILLHPRYETASQADILVFACFFAGAAVCLGMSATYHTLCNHSESVAKWGNKLDYSGIVVLIVGSYVPALWYGLGCHGEGGLMSFYLGMIALLGLGCLAVSWFEHFRTPAWRPYRALMFVGLGASGVVPIVHMLVTDYSYSQLNELMGLNWVIFQGALYMLGAFIYAARWPERQNPGKFDIWGSSHQIFHVCVVLAAASHLYGMVKAFDFHHSVLDGHCQVR
ncbi:hemolysin-III channel protein Izh2 [Podospora aff. communis PSN243]|uniref:Hemolysin-III channel protein Izh2 n=1 Tax=Podospora aff. communis PSN243 TaxID=3040156 RepID=A0AAV9GE13_9PEZI|nr:hemolysin-III channel protein Izh2 [Podospora aff. communis PSN243]